MKNMGKKNNKILISDHIVSFLKSYRENMLKKFIYQVYYVRLFGHDLSKYSKKKALTLS